MPAKHTQSLSRRNRRLTLFAALLAATSLVPNQVHAEQQSVFRLLPPKSTASSANSIEMTDEGQEILRRLPDTLAENTEAGNFQRSQVENSDTERSSAEPSSTEPSSTEPSSTEPSSTEPSSTEPSSTDRSSTEHSSAQRSSIGVPAQNATYRDVHSTLQMQPVAGPIFGRGNRKDRPFMRFLAPSHQHEHQRQARPNPAPPAARVARQPQVPDPIDTGGWVSRNQTPDQEAAPTTTPLRDPGLRFRTPSYANAPTPDNQASPEPTTQSMERYTQEIPVRASQSPIASRLQIKVRPTEVDPPSLAAPETDSVEPEEQFAVDAKVRPSKSVLSLRPSKSPNLLAPTTESESQSAMTMRVPADIVELVPPSAPRKKTPKNDRGGMTLETKVAKESVPSAEVVTRRLKEIPESSEAESMRDEVAREADEQQKLLAAETETETETKAESKSQRIATRSTPTRRDRSVSAGDSLSQSQRSVQRDRVGDLDTSSEQPITLDYVGMPAQKIEVSPYVQQMKPGISRVLQYFYDRPEIAAGRSNWGMMHAIMVYGVDTRCAVGNQTHSTIAWIAGNNICRGQKLLTQKNGRLFAKSGVGLQGHQAQMLAVFSLCDVPTDYPLYAGNTKYSMQHLIEEEKLACKSGEELTFTLIGLSHYMDTDAKWIAADGQRWDFQRLIREELQQPINGVACGGTHRLMGYAHALRNRRVEGKPITGQWARAEQYVRDFVNYTYSLQNRDGSMSTNWYEGRGDNRDVDRKIQTTGHMVEFLITATPDSQLQDPRLVRAIAFLMNSLNRDLGHEWKIGPKGHALRSLAMYHDRIFKSGPAFRRQSVAQRSSSQRSYR